MGGCTFFFGSASPLAAVLLTDALSLFAGWAAVVLCRGVLVVVQLELRQFLPQLVPLLLPLLLSEENHNTIY